MLFSAYNVRMITPVKRFLQDFFGLSRTETNGFLLFLPVLLLIIFSKPLYAWWAEGEVKNSAADRIMLDSLVAQWNARKSAGSTKAAPAPPTATKMFSFDPNNVSQEAMESLGFSPAIASRIIHYREKNGRFIVKSDMTKIYGMDVRLYEKLYPYIQLPDKLEKQSQRAVAENKFGKGLTRERVRFDLNKADTAELKRIYGIGVKLSERIVRYRQTLGGFVTMEQLKEVYGLDSAVINRLNERAFIDASFVPARININQATENELRAHPYLTKAAASAIAAYRFQHGNFRDVNDLHVLRVLSDETIRKIGPYLEFDN